jgi:hypothetical protein
MEAVLSAVGDGDLADELEDLSLDADAPAPGLAATGFGTVGEAGDRWSAAGPAPDLEEDFSFGYTDDDPAQIALRAVFGTDETIDLESAIELASGLPGIAACVFIDGQRAISAGDFDPQGSFAERAPKVFASVRELAGAMGIGDATTFTIRTEGGIMSFFTEGDRCLGVLHAVPGFLPGVREKLTLVSRGLAGLALPS